MIFKNRTVQDLKNGIFLPKVEETGVGNRVLRVCAAGRVPMRGRGSGDD